MKTSVFLVGDNAVLRDGLGPLLEANPDMTVVGGANNGRDAVERVRQLRPDVIIMDIAVPNVNDIETTVHIKKALPSAKVIILSVPRPDTLPAQLMQGHRGFC